VVAGIEQIVRVAEGAPAGREREFADPPVVQEYVGVTADGPKPGSTERLAL
jgi:hypothetical protein